MSLKSISAEGWNMTDTTTRPVANQEAAILTAFLGCIVLSAEDSVCFHTAGLALLHA
jgi:hypothetical protein